MILCCGESLIDMLPRTTRQGEAAFAPVTGGAVYNTAIALGRLGAPTGYFGGISNDLFGEMLIEDLAHSQVDAALALRSDAPTTLAFVKLVDGHAQYAFYDENTAGRSLTPEQIPTLTPTTTAAFFGGISLVSEPAAEAYATLLEQSAADRVVMIDPNVRPSFIKDEAGYRARITKMLSQADIVKVSDEDLIWLMGTQDPTALFDKSETQLVLMTRGEKGASAITRREHLEVPAQKTQVVDTVGAGDTFNAGVLAGLHEAGLLDKSVLLSCDISQMRTAIEMGVKAAAITVARAGANPPWRSEV